MAIKNSNLMFYTQVGHEEAIVEDEVVALLKRITGISDSDMELKLGIPVLTENKSVQYPVQQYKTFEFEGNDTVARTRFFILHIAKSSIFDLKFERFVLGSILTTAQEALNKPYGNGVDLMKNFEVLWYTRVGKMMPVGRVTQQAINDIGKLYFTVFGTIVSFVLKGTVKIDKYKHDDGSGTFIIATTPVKLES